MAVESANLIADRLLGSDVPKLSLHQLNGTGKHLLNHHVTVVDHLRLCG
jgi:hypothetical protein